MSFPDLAGLGGIGFVLVGIAINIIYVRARLPLTMSGRSLDEVADDFATVADALKRPSVLAQAPWLFLTLFAAGLPNANSPRSVAPTPHTRRPR